MTEHTKTASMVLAEFTIRPGCLDAFLAIAREDARLSAAREPGCRPFDVVQPQSADDRIVLYGVYDDRAAFEVHLQTQHHPEKPNDCIGRDFTSSISSQTPRPPL